MLQFPGFMTQYPWSTSPIPTSYVVVSQWAQPQNEDLILSLEESDLEDKLNDIRKSNINLIVIGKATADNEKEDYDNVDDDDDDEDDDADNAEESEGEEFEQETV